MYTYTYDSFGLPRHIPRNLRHTAANMAGVHPGLVFDQFIVLGPELLLLYEGFGDFHVVATILDLAFSMDSPFYPPKKQTFPDIFPANSGRLRDS